VNTKKQGIVKKTEDYYNNNDISSIVIYTDKGLNAHEIKNVKSSLWNIGNTMAVKNTLFERFLKNNNFTSYDTLNGKNIAIFCKDAFETISNTNSIIKKMKVNNKVSLVSAFIDKNYFNNQNVQKLVRYSSFQNLIGDTCFTLQAPMIVLAKILTLAAEENKGK
jgi:ribosomal protein L10